MEWFDEEEDDVERLLLLCECFDLLDLLLLLWEVEEDLEDEEEDDLCLLLFFVLCLSLGKSLLLRLGDVYLLSDTQVLLGGAMTMLGSDIGLKSGSRGSNTLFDVEEFWGSFGNDCSELLFVFLVTW